jgi:thiamine biosynthesis lipoprotein
VSRPPGVLFDTGGTGKGLAADAVAAALWGYSRFVIDAAGDLRIGGSFAAVEPYRVAVEHPFDGEPLGSIVVKRGGIATSGVVSRLWRRGDGGFAHHLLDPATGEPAWTGVVSVTALAPTALEAETLAKEVLLRGPDAAAPLLARWGGVVVDDEGTVEWIAAREREHVGADSLIAPLAGARAGGRAR